MDVPNLKPLLAEMKVPTLFICGREDKVLTVSSYLPGDGADGKPRLLVSTHVATARDAHAFGQMAAVEADRRGYRTAAVAIGMGDGGNWIDPAFDRHFRLDMGTVCGPERKR